LVVRSVYMKVGWMVEHWVAPLDMTLVEKLAMQKVVRWVAM